MPVEDAMKEEDEPPPSKPTTVVDTTTEPRCPKKPRLQDQDNTVTAAVASAPAAAKNENNAITTKTQQEYRCGKKTSKNKIKTKHMDPRILKVRRTIQEGCRTNNLVSAMEAYKEAIANDILIEAQSGFPEELEAVWFEFGGEDLYGNSLVVENDECLEWLKSRAEKNRQTGKK